MEKKQNSINQKELVQEMSNNPQTTLFHKCHPFTVSAVQSHRI